MKRLFIRLLTVVFCSVLSQAYAEYQPPSKGKVLIVAASPATGANGWPVGFWMAELSHPYEELNYAGYAVEIASPEGGVVELDAYSDPRHESGYSAHDIVSLGFLTSPIANAQLSTTIPLKDVDHEDYVAIVVAGGVAPMLTFRENKTLQTLILDFYLSGRPTAALCHGVSSLVDIKLPNKKYLVDGKNITAFSVAEDKEVEKSINGKFFDWYIEEALKERGANYLQGGLWADFAVQDGNLISGQQQYSGRTVARMVAKLLEE